MTGPWLGFRHQQRCMWDAWQDGTDFEFFISFYCKTAIGQGLNETCAQYCNRICMKLFSKVYCDRVYFLCAERFVRSGFESFSAPHTHLRGESECAPPPPPPPGLSWPRGFCAQKLDRDNRNYTLAQKLQGQQKLHLATILRLKISHNFNKPFPADGTQCHQW